MDHEVLKGALRDLVMHLDYDLAKAIDDPEDDDADTWDDYTKMLARYIEKYEEASRG